MSHVPIHKVNGPLSPTESPNKDLVAELPEAQEVEQPEERVPTPFPAVQQPSNDHVVEELPPLPLVMPLPSSQSPAREVIIDLPSDLQSDLQSSSESSPSFTRRPPPPLSPLVHVLYAYRYRYGLSRSSSDTSFEPVGLLIQQLRDDRRQLTRSQSVQSVSTGLYTIANTIMPQLPNYETLSNEESIDINAAADFRERRRDLRRFFHRMCMATGLIASAVIGQQVGYMIFKSNAK